MVEKDGDDDKEVEKSTTVLLWGREDVIGQGVEYLLRSRKDWEVIRILGEDNFDDLLLEAEKVNADVVIIYQGDCNRDSQWALQLMKCRPGIKVITFSLENSMIEVYDNKKVWVKEVTDLLDIV